MVKKKKKKWHNVAFKLKEGVFQKQEMKCFPSFCLPPMPTLTFSPQNVELHIKYTLKITGLNKKLFGWFSTRARSQVHS